VGVGILASCIQQHRTDDVEFIRENLTLANELLVAAGLPAHLEPEHFTGVEWIAEVRPGELEYSSIYRLGRLAAKRRLHKQMAAESAKEDPLEDPDLQRAIASPDFHLIANLNAEGVYVPIVFDAVLSDAEGLIALGSSHKLLTELIEVAPALEIHIAAAGEVGAAEMARIVALADDERTPLRGELLAWLSFYKGARASIKHGTALWSHLR
jgi:hypothetical protein